MASRNFKPKASSNIIEGATPVEEVVTPVEQEEVAEPTSTPAPLETPVAEATEATDHENEKVEETSPTVTFAEEKSNKTPAEKNVKIRTRVNHSCCIGGVRYHFEKGKQTNVPESVKAILLQADLLMPL